MALQTGPPGLNQRSRSPPIGDLSPGRFAQVHPSREPLAAALCLQCAWLRGFSPRVVHTSAHRAFAQAPPPRAHRSSVEPGHRCRPVGRSADTPFIAGSPSPAPSRLSPEPRRAGAHCHSSAYSARFTHRFRSAGYCRPWVLLPEGFSAGSELAARACARLLHDCVWEHGAAHRHPYVPCCQPTARPRNQA